MPAPVDIGVNLSENYTQMPELAKNGAGSASVYLSVFLATSFASWQNEFCQLAKLVFPAGKTNLPAGKMIARRILPAGKICFASWQNEFASWQNKFCQLAK